MSSNSKAPYTLQDHPPKWSRVKVNVHQKPFIYDNEHPEFYMSEQVSFRLQNDKTQSKEDKMTIQYLAMRKFHIPGNGFWEDYMYW